MAKKTKQAPAAKKPKGPTTLWWEHADPSLDDLRKALRPFGLRVIEHPDFEGTDCVGYLISDHKLSRAEIKAECCPADEEG